MALSWPFQHETPTEGGAASKTKGARKDLPAMHYTANAAPQVIEPTGDLDLQLFNEVSGSELSAWASRFYGDVRARDGPHVHFVYVLVR